MRIRAGIAALGATAALALGAVPGVGAGRAPCPHYGRPALASDPRPRALRVFAVQFEQQPSRMVSAQDFERAVDCVMRVAVAPYLARGRPNLVVFDEDVGLETLVIGPRGASARGLLRHGVGACRGQPFPCATLATLSALDSGYALALKYVSLPFPSVRTQLGRVFIAATDEFVRVFMGTMAAVARRYRVYLVASNTQAPFRLTHNREAAAYMRNPSTPGIRAVYLPTAGRAYDQVFLWGPRVVNAHAPAPLQNLLADNRKVPLTSFEQALGFAAGPARGGAARANLRPFAISGTDARLGFATSLPAFEYGPNRRGHQCDDVAVTYMRCLDRLGANVVIQADANDGQWTGPDGSNAAESWQPLSWMGSAWRAVSDPTVRFAYAVNPMMVGNLADTPFDGQSAILERGRRGSGCHYVGDRAFVSSEDDPALRRYAGSKPQFLALAPWAAPDGPRAALRPVGEALASGRRQYVQTTLIADLTFPVDRIRRGCLVAGALT
jgi:hypothetical protein